MNRLYLIGNLTADPVLAATASGISVCTFSLAVNQPGSKQADGQNGVTYFRCSVWGAQGENCARFLKKGSKVFVCGEVKASAYTSRDGTSRASLEVSCREVEFLSSGEQKA
ncbi:MAG: single-stranded DNA-binding protein [Clostridiales bacterium]|jgi:single-strand DNA-binding protein|nr:single-stranded DNA-binding protein [Clostridia bacterium]MCR4884307.1 single-stranded DNA-binding protein [Clostridiales bacterium]